MNAEKLTTNSAQAISNAKQLAHQYGNPEYKQEHLLYSLLTMDDSLISNLIKQMNPKNTDVDALLVAGVLGLIEAMPKVQGGMEPYPAQDIMDILEQAEADAKYMKDEYTSVEHVFMGIIEKANENVAELFKRYKIDKNGFLKALSDVRGSARVTTDNPEGTYNALKKYGQNLTQLAKDKKLDPVIGRDDEIRNVIRILSRKTKNNPCIIGEPGVGKTAIVEGLALRIERGDVQA